MSAPRLYLFVGFPGAGKTTVAHLIHQTTGAVHLWADKERQAMFAEVTHSPAESEQLYAALNQRTEALLAEGKDVIFDTNFNYVKDRQHLQTIAQAHGAETIVIWVCTPPELSRERALHERHRDRNGYDVVMSPSDYDRLTNHLEPPTVNENFIKIDGTDIDPQAVKRQLGI